MWNRDPTVRICFSKIWLFLHLFHFLYDHKSDIAVTWYSLIEFARNRHSVLKKESIICCNHRLTALKVTQSIRQTMSKFLLYIYIQREKLKFWDNIKSTQHDLKHDNQFNGKQLHCLQYTTLKVPISQHSWLICDTQ